jgi:hypothetical protein
MQFKFRISQQAVSPDKMVNCALEVNMRYLTEFLHCGEVLLESLEVETQELSDVLTTHPWSPNFSLDTPSTTFRNQAAYNKSLSETLSEKGWQVQPRLSDSPRLMGDFAKGLVFGEVQFGNSATLYRDFYKFQYGLQNGLLSLAVLIVPYNEYEFCPTRRKSVKNMANFALARRYFTVLPISVPTIIYGLLADGENASNLSLQGTQ